MKLSAIFESGDQADSAARELKSAGIEILARKTVTLDSAPPRTLINDRMYIPPAGVAGFGILSGGIGMYPYDLPPMSPPINLMGDLPIDTDRSRRVRLQLELDAGDINHARGILVTNNGTDVQAY